MVAHFEQLRRERRIEDDAKGLGQPLGKDKSAAGGGVGSDGGDVAANVEGSPKGQ